MPPRLEHSVHGVVSLNIALAKSVFYHLAMSSSVIPICLLLRDKEMQWCQRMRQSKECFYVGGFVYLHVVTAKQNITNIIVSILS